MSLFKGLVSLAGDVATIVTAPVEVAVAVTGAVVKPVADMAKELTEEVTKGLDLDA